MAVAPSGAGQKQFSLPWASPSRARAGDVHRRLPKIDWTDRDKSLNPVVVCDFATQAAAFSTSHFAGLASVRGCWVCTLYPISDAVHGLSVFLTLRHSAPNDLSKLERDFTCLASSASLPANQCFHVSLAPEEALFCSQQRLRLFSAAIALQNCFLFCRILGRKPRRGRSVSEAHRATMT